MFTRNSQHSSPSTGVRHAFTLVELLMAISVIAVLSTFVLVALAGVNQTAKEDRTKAQLAKINELLMDKWASYQYRRVPTTSRLLATRKRLSNYEQWLEAESAVRWTRPACETRLFSPRGRQSAGATDGRVAATSRRTGWSGLVGPLKDSRTLESRPEGSSCRV